MEGIRGGSQNKKCNRKETNRISKLLMREIQTGVVGVQVHQNILGEKGGEFEERRSTQTEL